MNRLCRRALTLLILACCSALPLRAADEAPRCELLRRDSLAGWTYGGRLDGWQMDAGTLRASEGAMPLISGFSFSDFELQFEWQGDAALLLQLPQRPRDAGMGVSLKQGNTCGEVFGDGTQPLLAGAQVAPTADGWHAGIVRRQGAKLSVSIDGKAIGDATIDAGLQLGLGLAVKGKASFRNVTLLEPPGEPLCNGRDLTGWHTPGTKDAWIVRDGAIVLVPGGGNYLRTEKQYGNFTLSLQCRIKKGGNSGIGIRTPPAGWPSSDGMELQILDRPGTDKHAALSIYGNMPPLGINHRSDEWNKIVVKADGRMISAWMNGQLVQHANTADHPELKHRPLQGWIGLQDHGATIEVKEMRILEAPEGEGPVAGTADSSRTAGGAIVERLMNPAALSIDDGIVGHAIEQTIDGPGDHVLADLVGPGALTWIGRTTDEGRLAFYFDGEDKPRIDCKAGDLRGALPLVAENNNPVTTCLLYAKSLKVVLRQAKKTGYRLEYVTFPASMPIESFTSQQSGIPRGWADAAVYRFGMYSHGVQREHDSRPRLESPRRSLAPGKREELAKVDGAGIVHWLKLKADKQWLDNTDLWLEVTVDGEDLPAIAAPVRFWFAPLAGQGNFHNFLFLDRGGPVTTLAMPYGKGIVVAAVNRGAKKIDAGVQLCYEPATEVNRDEIAGRMRLRAQFRPADAAAPSPPAGRLVGLVFDDAGGAGDAVDLLLGQRGEQFRSAQAGRNQSLAWRFFQSAAPDANGAPSAPLTGNSLTWVYTKANPALAPNPRVPSARR
jgi:hypothetical protein